MVCCLPIYLSSTLARPCLESACVCCISRPPSKRWSRGICTGRREEGPELRFMKHLSLLRPRGRKNRASPASQIAYLQLAPRPILSVLPYSTYNTSYVDWVPGWSYALRLNLRPVLHRSSPTHTHTILQRVTEFWPAYWSPKRPLSCSSRSHSGRNVHRSVATSILHC